MAQAPHTNSGVCPEKREAKSSREQPEGGVEEAATIIVNSCQVIDKHNDQERFEGLDTILDINECGLT